MPLYPNIIAEDTSIVVTGNQVRVGSPIPTAIVFSAPGDAVTVNNDVAVGGVVKHALGAVGAPSMTFVGDLNTGIYSSGPDVMVLVTNGAQRVEVSNTSVLVKVTLFVETGLVGSPSIAIVGDANTGIYSSAADTLDVTCGGVNSLSIGTAGVTATVPFLAPAGAVGAPSYSFAGDPDSGFYNVGPNIVALVVGASEHVRWTFGQTRAASGTAALPAYSYGGDTNTGIYNSAADEVSISTNGVLRVTCSTTTLTSTLPWRGPSGAQATPSLSFSGDTDTGAFSDVADTFKISTAATLRLSIDTVSVTSALPYRGGLESAATPTYAFTTDPNTGVFSSGADALDFSAGGTSRVTVSTTAVTATVPVVVPLGAMATPTLTFAGDLNTGIYSPGADQVEIVTGGANRITIASGAITVATQFRQAAGSAAAPSYSFNGDNNTGVFSPGADQIDLATGGTAWARVNATGEVSLATSLIVGAALGTAPTHTLDSRGEISIFGASNALARLRLRGWYAASPADPPADQTDIIVVDTGAAQFLRVRYNNAGAMKVGDLALV